MTIFTVYIIVYVNLDSYRVSSLLIRERIEKIRRLNDIPIDLTRPASFFQCEHHESTCRQNRHLKICNNM
jgi:hypothetical protein